MSSLEKYVNQTIPVLLQLSNLQILLHSCLTFILAPSACPATSMQYAADHPDPLRFILDWSSVFTTENRNYSHRSPPSICRPPLPLPPAAVNPLSLEGFAAVKGKVKGFSLLKGGGFAAVAVNPPLSPPLLLTPLLFPGFAVRFFRRFRCRLIFLQLIAVLILGVKYPNNSSDNGGSAYTAEDSRGFNYRRTWRVIAVAVFLLSERHAITRMCWMRRILPDMAEI